MSNRKIQLKIMVSPEENEIIRKNAKACGRTPSAYIREMATNMYVLKNNYKAIEEHTQEISVTRNAINHLVFTIRKTGRYVPPDIEYILEKMKAIFKVENQFLQNILQFQEALREELMKEVQSIVNDHLDENVTHSQRE